jgi:sulfite reductase (NADPH) flavoprotein alpha-component
MNSPTSSWTIYEPIAKVRSVKDLSIYYGTETGNSRFVAETIAAEARARGAEVSVEDLVNVLPSRLATQGRPVVIVISTWNRGKPPFYARRFCEELEKGTVRMDSVHYAVVGLGDEHYELFCACGRNVDAALEKAGAVRFAERVDLGASFRKLAPGVAKTLLDLLAKLP